MCVCVLCGVCVCVYVFSSFFSFLFIMSARGRVKGQGKRGAVLEGIIRECQAAT